MAQQYKEEKLDKESAAALYAGLTAANNAIIKNRKKPTTKKPTTKKPTAKRGK